MGALTPTGHSRRPRDGATSENKPLSGTGIGTQSAMSEACLRTMSAMFRITQNTLRYFTLAEVLLMATMNQLEAKQKVGRSEENTPSYCPFRAEAV